MLDNRQLTTLTRLTVQIPQHEADCVEDEWGLKIKKVNLLNVPGHDEVKEVQGLITMASARRVGEDEVLRGVR